MTLNGDCIIAVRADKAPSDFAPDFKRILQDEGAKFMMMIEADDRRDVVSAWGSSSLSMESLRDFVVRKSEYVSRRTLAIKADKAAIDLSRELVSKLRNPNQQVRITLKVAKQ